MAFQTSGDPCLNIFAAVWPAHIDFRHGAHVLEIGCAEANWITPMKQARPDLHVTGVDWRACDRPGAELVIRGDVLQQDFPPRSFDAVVLISALEHIGLGHYDKDPVHKGGDSECLQRVWHWLTDGGFVYFDVPWNPDPGYKVLGTECRVYDDASLANRLGRTATWVSCVQAWTTLDDTTHLLPTRPTMTHDRFYYCANVWAKV